MRQDYPAQSAGLAGDRLFDVYFGIDVFGRGAYGGGKYACNQAVDVIREAQVSAAVFAPGWVLECDMSVQLQQPLDEHAQVMFHSYQDDLRSKTIHVRDE